MNDIETIKTFYIRNSRTLESTVVSSRNEKKLFFIYNYEGLHYRLFDSKIEVRKFFNGENAMFLEFEDDETLDFYLLNCQI
jgi:hypothetical protein